MRIWIRRRQFIAGLGGAAAWPLAARAQQGNVRRIGVLMAGDENDPVWKPRLFAFAQALAALGWTDGRNVRTDVHWAAPDDIYRIRALAQELVGLQPDIILASATPATGFPNSGQSFLPEAAQASRDRLFRPNVLEVTGGNLFDLGACDTSGRSETQQGADFVKGKSKFPGTPYESEHAKVRFPINAPAASRARRHGQHLDPFVVADRLNIDAAALREFADRQIFCSRKCDGAHRKTLDPVATTGCIFCP
jgi:hypothetical protein